MSTFKSTATLVPMLALLSSAAHAAPLLNLSAKIDRATITGTNTTLFTINAAQYFGPPTTADYQIEVDATLTGLPAGESLGDISFNIDFASPVGQEVNRPPTAHYNYMGNNPFWTDDGGTPHAVFSTNADKGPSSSDLQAIAAVIDNGAYTENFGSPNDPGDPRDLIANGTTFKLGTFYFNWNVPGAVTISFSNVQFAPLDDTTLVYGPTFVNNATISPATLQEVVNMDPPPPPPKGPEPTSLAILATGGLILLKRRR